MAMLGASLSGKRHFHDSRVEPVDKCDKIGKVSPRPPH